MQLGEAFSKLVDLVLLKTTVLGKASVSPQTVPQMEQLLSGFVVTHTGTQGYTVLLGFLYLCLQLRTFLPLHLQGYNY